MSLGTELRTARTQAGLTQEQLAFAAGLDRAYISQLEHDHKSPTVDTLVRLCGPLGVRASELLARVERTEGTSSTPPPVRPMPPDGTGSQA
jgi:transcriptional regulator with XRE-family HTH domain